MHLEKEVVNSKVCAYGKGNYTYEFNQDVRSIIHWVPTISIDKNDKAKVVFWNSSLPSIAMLDLQGFIDKRVTASKRGYYFVNGLGFIR